jgi:hypothetical protein
MYCHHKAQLPLAVNRKPKVVEEGRAWAGHCALLNALKVHTQLHKNSKMT